MVSETSISRDSESYRRGVVFGLTMAEVLLLLIFCLLLVLSDLYRKKQNIEKELVTEQFNNNLLEVKNSELEEEVKKQQ